MTSRMSKLLAGLLALVMFCSVLGGSLVTADYALAEGDAAVVLELPEVPEVTAEPTAEPTEAPTAEPTAEPTEAPTAEPTAEPTEAPTAEPTAEPTEAPTAEPTAEPTEAPTAEPTAEPTEVPTAEPTAEPTEAPTAEPTAEPTEAPTAEPTAEPAPAFVSGYGWVNAGDKIYTGSGLSKVLGKMTGRSVVYYADYSEEQDSYKVAFVTDGQVKTGWIRGTDAVRMSAGESESYGKKVSGAYSYNGHPLEAAAFEPAAKPTEAPTAVPTPEPTPDPETVLKNKAEAMMTSRPERSARKNKAVVKEQEQPQTFNLELGAVTNLQGKPVDTNATYMKWDEVAGADGYQVMRSATAEGTYSFLKNVDVPEARNYSLTPGGTYYYKVRAYVLNEDGSKTFGESSDYVQISVLGTCDNFGVYAVDTNASKLVWNAVAGATGYQVFRTVAGSGEYVWVKNNPTAGVNNYSLTPGTTYYYKIRAYVDLPDGTRAYGQFTEGKKIYILDQVRNLTLRTSGNAMNLDWSDTPAITGYQVFYTIAGTGGEYTWAKNVSVSEARHTNLNANTDYYYKVRAYVDQPNGVRAYGQLSNAVHMVTGMAAPGSVRTDAKWNGPAGITIAWKPVPGNVPTYNVYRMDTNGSTWTQIGRVPGDSAVTGEDGTQEIFFTDANVVPNRTYTYTVQASSGSKVSQKGTPKVSATAKMNTPQFTDIHGISGARGMYLAWTDVGGVDSYEIQWRMEEEAFQTLTTYTEAEKGNHEVVSLEDSSLPSGCILYFRVRAKHVYQGTAYYSSWSTTEMAVKPFVRCHSVKARNNGYCTDVWFDVINFCQVPIVLGRDGTVTPTEGAQSYEIENWMTGSTYTVHPDERVADMIYTIKNGESVYLYPDHEINLTFSCYGEKYGIRFGTGGYEWYYIGN